MVHALKIAGFFLILLQIASLPAAHAGTNHKNDLNQLQSKIDTIQRGIDEDQKKKQTLHVDLKNIELKVSKHSKKLNNLNKQLRRSKTQLETLHSEIQHLKIQQATQQQQLKQSMLKAYQSGKEPYLKLLLNQKDPSTLARKLRYYQYFSVARQEKISSFESTIKKLAILEQKTKTLTSQQQTTKTNLSSQQISLQKSKNSRSKAIKNLTHSLLSKDKQLSALQQEQKALEELIKSVQNANTNSPGQAHTSFAKQKGKLNWPSKGRITAAFGSARSDARLRWNGTLISAPEGQTIQAIHSGRIVYANWLRGFGLLTMIDHGDGYLSLYGHSQTLLKEVGDWVLPGETISTVGNSGGQSNAGVYFEIRENGKPHDPIKWCKKRN